MIAMTMFIATASWAQTSFQKTAEKFKNSEFVWNVVSSGQKVGEFWPVHGLNLVTKTTDPNAFNGSTDIATIQKSMGGVATAPDGMTGGSVGAYQMQGRCLSHGRPCGDGFLYQYGIVLVSSTGFQIQFTHKNEITNFDSLYSSLQSSRSSLFFLPSIYRNGSFLPSEKTIDKVLIRRETPDGDQIGVIVFSQMVTCNRAREIVLGLDRPGASKTTHIYVLDGGGIWGQSCKETNGQARAVGTRDANSVTNYLVFY